MQVQHRPLLIGTWILGASLLTASACDHQGRKSESPDAAESEELATLRRDNANLRARIQNLEEQVRILEQEERWTAEDRGYRWMIGTALSASGISWLDARVAWRRTWSPRSSRPACAPSVGVPSVPPAPGAVTPPPGCGPRSWPRRGGRRRS